MLVQEAKNIQWNILAEQFRDAINLKLEEANRNTPGKPYTYDKRLYRRTLLVLNEILTEQENARLDPGKLKITYQKLAILVLTFCQTYRGLFTFSMIFSGFHNTLHKMITELPAMVSADDQQQNDNATYKLMVSISNAYKSPESNIFGLEAGADPEPLISEMVSRLSNPFPETLEAYEVLRLSLIDAVDASLKVLEQKDRLSDTVKRIAENLFYELNQMGSFTTSSSREGVDEGETELLKFKKQQLILLLLIAGRFGKLQDYVYDLTGYHEQRVRLTEHKFNLDKYAFSEKIYDLKNWVELPLSATGGESSVTVALNSANISWENLKSDAIAGVKEYQTTHEGGFIGKFRAARLLEALEALSIDNSETPGYFQKHQRRELILLLAAVIGVSNAFYKNTRLAEILIVKINMDIEKLKTLFKEYRIPVKSVSLMDRLDDSSYEFRAQKLEQPVGTDVFGKKSWHEIRGKLIAAGDNYLARHPSKNAGNKESLNKVNNFNAFLKSLAYDDANADTINASINELYEIIYLWVTYSDVNHFQDEVLATIGFNSYIFDAFFHWRFFYLSKKDADMVFDFSFGRKLSTPLDWDAFKQALQAAAAEYLNKKTDSEVNNACARNLMEALKKIDKNLNDGVITDGKARRKWVMLAFAIVFESEANALAELLLNKTHHTTLTLKLLRRDHVIGFSYTDVIAWARKLKKFTVVNSYIDLKDRVIKALENYCSADLGGDKGKRRAQYLLMKLKTPPKTNKALIDLIYTVFHKTSSKLLRTAILDVIADIEPHGLDEKGLKNLWERLGSADLSDIADEMKSYVIKDSLPSATPSLDRNPENLIAFKGNLENALNYYMKANIAGKEGKRRAQVAYQMLRDIGLTTDLKEQLSSIVNYLLNRGAKTWFGGSQHLLERILIHTGISVSELKNLLNISVSEVNDREEEAADENDEISSNTAVVDSQEQEHDEPQTALVNSLDAAMDQLVKNIFIALDAYQINNMGSAVGKYRVAAIRYKLEEIFLDSSEREAGALVQAQNRLRLWSELTKAQKIYFPIFISKFIIQNNLGKKLKDNILQTTGYHEADFEKLRKQFSTDVLYTKILGSSTKELFADIKIRSDETPIFTVKDHFLELQETVLKVAQRYSQRPKSQRNAKDETCINNLIAALKEIKLNDDEEQVDLGDSLVALIRVIHLFVKHTKTDIQDDILASIELRFGDFDSVKESIAARYHQPIHANFFDAEKIFSDSVSYSFDVPSYNWRHFENTVKTVKAFLPGNTMENRINFINAYGSDALTLADNFLKFLEEISDFNSEGNKRKFIIFLSAIVFQADKGAFGAALLKVASISKDQLKRLQYDCGVSNTPEKAREGIFEIGISNNAVRNEFFELQQKAVIENWPQFYKNVLEAIWRYFRSGIVKSVSVKKAILNLLLALEKIKTDLPMPFHEKRKLIELIKAASQLNGCPNLMNVLFDFTGMSTMGFENLTKSFDLKSGEKKLFDSVNRMPVNESYNMLFIAASYCKKIIADEATKKAATKFIQDLTTINEIAGENAEEVEAQKYVKILALMNSVIKEGDEKLSEKLLDILPYTEDDLNAFNATEPNRAKRSAKQELLGMQMTSRLPSPGRPAYSPALFHAAQSELIEGLQSDWANKAKLENAIRLYLIEKGEEANDEGTLRAKILQKALSEINLPGVEGEKKFALLLCATVLHSPYMTTSGSKNLSARMLAHLNLHKMQLEILQAHFKIKSECALLTEKIIDKKLLEKSRRVNVLNPVQDFNRLKTEVLLAIEDYLPAVKSNSGGYLKAQNLKKLIEVIDDLSDAAEQKKLAQILCSFVLYGNANTLNGKIFEKTTLNKDDFEYLKCICLEPSYDFINAFCVDQAKQFDSKANPMLLVYDVSKYNVPPEPYIYYGF
ncbi:MAG: hypothetical protein A3E82_08015 [Gammaproteobacteria bacterium RIFCSPHIGHO2_12_FULL_38_11]|nr:MAG: hypothetical protein A3E82_08015 [Gammaproteobacteria bacterium RIFCSPHIGHO2_12_FULL_38_11]